MLSADPIANDHELLIFIIKALASIIGSLVLAIGTIATIFYKSFMGRFDKVDVKLDPIDGLIALHSEQIKELKEDHAQLSRRINNHDSRIQTLEKITVHIRK